MTINKRKKAKQKILDALSDKAELSTNKGKLMFNKSFKLTSKHRRHSGWRTPQIVNKTMKYSEIIEQGLEPRIEYDDWDNWRDSMRDNSDTKHIFKKRGRYWKFSNDEIKGINKRNKKKLSRKHASKKLQTFIKLR